MMLVFQVIGRIGSNSVSTSLRERRSSAIFPKRCNAGGRAGSSWRWLGANLAFSFALTQKKQKVKALHRS